MLSCIILLMVIVSYLLNRYHQRTQSINQRRPRILPVTLLLRSYCRPEYLRRSVASLQESDIHLCRNRLIYDDGSEDPQTLRVLKDLHNPTKENGFRVLLHDKNVGCRQSYVDALDTLRGSSDFDASGYTCVIDNDVSVNRRLVEQLFFVYRNATESLKTGNVVLSGFNPSNAHLTSAGRRFQHFHIRRTVGGVCYFFGNQLIDIVKKAWSENEDWGVNDVFNSRPNHYMICVNQSLVNHIGEHGLHSSMNGYDIDDKFSVDTSIDGKPVKAGVR